MAVIHHIKELSQLPDIITFQEVIPETQSLLIRHLGGSYAEKSYLDGLWRQYFTMVFIKHEMKYLSGERLEFPCGSGMGRDILSSSVEVCGRVVTCYRLYISFRKL